MALTFFWRCENSATLDGTNDFSAGDTTGTATGSPTFSGSTYRVGTYAVSFPSGTRYSFDGTSLYSSSAGSIGFWFNRSGAVTSDAAIFTLRGSTSTDLIEIRSAGAGANLALYIRSSSPATSVNLPTDSASLTTNTWYFVVAKWDHTANDRYIAIYNTSGTLLDSAEDTSTAWDLPVSMPLASAGLRIGDNGGTATNTFYIDNVFLGTAYADADTFLTKRDITSYTEYAAAAGQPTGSRYSGIPGMNLISSRFGRGW